MIAKLKEELFLKDYKVAAAAAAAAATNELRKIQKSLDS